MQLFDRSDNLRITTIPRHFHVPRINHLGPFRVPRVSYEPRGLAHRLAADIKSYDWLAQNHSGVQLVWYEDLVDRPEEVLRQLGALTYPVSADTRRRIYEVMAADSQEGTRLSRQNLSTREFRPNTSMKFRNEWEKVRPEALIERYGLARLG